MTFPLFFLVCHQGAVIAGIIEVLLFREENPSELFARQTGRTRAALLGTKFKLRRLRYLRGFKHRGKVKSIDGTILLLPLLSRQSSDWRRKADLFIRFSFCFVFVHVVRI